MSAQPTPEQIFLERLGALERDALAVARMLARQSISLPINNPRWSPFLAGTPGFRNTVLGAHADLGDRRARSHLRFTQ
jgi:hypothetical protein